MTEMARPPYRVVTTSCDSIEIIDAEQLKNIFAQDALLRNSRTRAMHYLLAARKRAHAHRLVVNERAQREVKQAFEKMKSEASDAALTWLVQEQTWAQNLYEAIAERMYQSLRSQLYILFDSLPWDDLLLDIIEKVVQEARMGSIVNVYVSSDCYNSLSARLSTEYIHIHKDHTIKAGTAIVENTVMRVQIDLRSQLDNLLEQIGRLGGESQ